MKKGQAYVLWCQTGCSCCNSKDHYRGPYRTVVDANRRISYFLSKDAEFWPCASQYARRGHYLIEAVEYTKLEDGRVIVGHKVFSSAPFIEVDQDGRVADNDAEELGSELY